MFTQGDFTGIQKQKISLINKHFWIEEIFYYNILAKKVLQLQNLCAFLQKLNYIWQFFSETRIQSQMLHTWFPFRMRVYPIFHRIQ